VGVTVCVEGAATALYPDPRGTGRYYVEAREGARYEIRLDNRTRERLGVAVAVDGLDVISGEREGGSGRLYVLDPWGGTTVRGWRTSLSDVRRFVFVDEKASYAARSGKASGRMGWIEVTVYQDSQRLPHRLGLPHPLGRLRDHGGREDELGQFEGPPPMRQERPSDDSDAPAAAPLGHPAAPEGAGKFPGTGWGARTGDPVVVVDFHPEASAAERVTLRYEYASTLRALGIRTRRDFARDRDRLRERERGDGGFARPPAW
jgi:hypothetical protein